MHNALVHEHSMRKLKQSVSPSSDEVHEVLLESGIHPGSSIKALLSSFNSRYSTLSKYNKSVSGSDKAVLYKRPSKHNTRIKFKASRLNDKA